MRKDSTWQQIYSQFSDTNLNECEALIGLTRPDEEFRMAIVDAAFMALCLQVKPPKRRSAIRKDREFLAAQAAAAATALQRLSDIFPQVVPRPPSHVLREPLATLMAPETINVLRELAEAAKPDADLTLTDTGGQPRVTAFSIFIRMLADAFGRATGKAATLTWDPLEDRYEGRFWKLVHQVLPIAEDLAGNFAPRTESARGKKIQRVLKRMDKTPTSRPR
jgi:hypothetical protein